ncbi:hypothetical protein CCOS865_04999 [Pseudomonas reidholzensis]|uniref:Uncharacterized protein n=1 Tax=Pseudomonas reidholzensis TaxID=1785162 RepID=A0A383S248_9PSED|nr:hypothetical protein CCOS865_04999 [Pseudomonas reidholzensis]
MAILLTHIFANRLTPVYTTCLAVALQGCEWLGEAHRVRFTDTYGRAATAHAG